MLLPSGLAWGYWLAVIGLVIVFNTGWILRVAMACIAGLLLLIPALPVQNWWEQRAKRAEAVRAAKAREEVRQAELERLPQLQQQLDGSILEAKWEEAAKLHDQVKKIRPDQPGLADAWAKIGPAVAVIREQRATEARRATLAQGLEETRKVVADKNLCDTPKAIAEAWKNLKVAKRQDPQWREAVSLTAQLEACRRKTEQSLSKGLRDIMVRQRVEWAKRAERAMLDQGMEVDFTLSGTNKDRVEVKWVLMGKAAVHKITDGGSMRDGSFLANLQKVGFRRVSFGDGHDFGVYYDLEPPVETQGGANVLASMGVGAPLRLE
jgi:hypothetical protein